MSVCEFSRSPWEKSTLRSGHGTLEQGTLEQGLQDTSVCLLLVRMSMHRLSCEQVQLSTLESICSTFDAASKVTPVTIRMPQYERTMLETLHTHKSFEALGSHSKFPAFQRNHLKRIDRIKFTKWINGHIKRLAKVQNKELTLHRQSIQGNNLEPFSMNPVETDWEEQSCS